MKVYLTLQIVLFVCLVLSPFNVNSATGKSSSFKYYIVTLGGGTADSNEIICTGAGTGVQTTSATGNYCTTTLDSWSKILANADSAVDGSAFLAAFNPDPTPLDYMIYETYSGNCAAHTASPAVTHTSIA